jgi:hypothetical protein
MDCLKTRGGLIVRAGNLLFLIGGILALLHVVGRDPKFFAIEGHILIKIWTVLMMGFIVCSAVNKLLIVFGRMYPLPTFACLGLLMLFLIFIFLIGVFVDVPRPDPNGLTVLPQFIAAIVGWLIMDVFTFVYVYDRDPPKQEN